jgi:SanA protein
MKVIIIIFAAAAVLILAATLLINWRVVHIARSSVYSSYMDIPAKKVGLLLGTSKYMRDGDINPYFYNRIESAVVLYKLGKIRYIIASGDNSKHEYNEPRQMFEALVEYGVEKQAIYLDYAGFRTLDSIVRCKEIFGQNSFIIITQDFHIHRAIYLAKKYSLDAVGFSARDVSGWGNAKILVREYLARVKAFLDINVLKKQPKFLGEKVRIE